jgi:hypothetical protein
VDRVDRRGVGRVHLAGELENVAELSREQLDFGLREVEPREPRQVPHLVMGNRRHFRMVT